MNTEEIVRARVVLRGSKTYKHPGGKRWIKDVPGVVEGAAEIKEFANNGRFRVSMLKSLSVSKNRKSLDTDTNVKEKFSQKLSQKLRPNNNRSSGKPSLKKK